MPVSCQIEFIEHVVDIAGRFPKSCAPFEMELDRFMFEQKRIIVWHEEKALAYGRDIRTRRPFEGHGSRHVHRLTAASPNNVE